MMNARFIGPHYSIRNLGTKSNPGRYLRPKMAAFSPFKTSTRGRSTPLLQVRRQSSSFPRADFQSLRPSDRLERSYAAHRCPRSAVSRLCKAWKVSEKLTLVPNLKIELRYSIEYKFRPPFLMVKHNRDYRPTTAVLPKVPCLLANLLERCRTNLFARNKRRFGVRSPGTTEVGYHLHPTPGQDSQKNLR